MNILKGFSRQQIIRAIIFLALFLVAYGAVIGLYKMEATRGVADFSSPDPGANYIEVFIKVTSIDPIKGDLTARIQFTPQGSFAVPNSSPNSSKVSQDVKFAVNTSTGKPDRIFDKGKIMEPVEVTVPLFDGQVNDYPFDRHQSFLELGMTSTTNPPVEIPMKVNFWSEVAGFSTVAALNADSTNSSYVGIDISTKRSITTILFSIFILVGMWIVGIIVFIQAQVVRSKGKMVEIGMFSYVATLTFALPTTRNIQPGIPPVGTLSDFLGFFWVEGLVTFSLMTIAYCWLTRYGKQ